MRVDGNPERHLSCTDGSAGAARRQRALQTLAARIASLQARVDDELTAAEDQWLTRELRREEIKGV